MLEVMAMQRYPVSHSSQRTFCSATRAARGLNAR